MQGMDYLYCCTPGQGTQIPRYQDELEKGDPRLLAALERIWPGKAAKAALYLDGCRSLCYVDAHPSVSLASIDTRFAEAWGRLSRCPSFLKQLKDLNPAVAETIRQWPALKKIFGL